MVSETVTLDATSLAMLLAALVRFVVGVVLAAQAGWLVYREGFASHRPWLCFGVAMLVWR